MHTEHDKVDPKILSQLKWDERDVNLSVIYKSLAGVGLTVIFGTVAGYLFVWKYDHPAATISHRANLIEAILPPGAPYIQNNSDAPADIAQVREHENDVLTTTGPATDPGYFHIPVDEAMKLILQRNLPVTGTALAVSKPVNPNAPPDKSASETHPVVAPAPSAQPPKANKPATPSKTPNPGGKKP